MAGSIATKLFFCQASIVGKRFGVHRWSVTTSKTLEGSIAFVVSILTAAFFLRLAGFLEAFSVCLARFNVTPLGLCPLGTDNCLQVGRYIAVAVISAILEALSDQNDNLTLPLFMWSMVAIAGV